MTGEPDWADRAEEILARALDGADVAGELAALPQEWRARVGRMIEARRAVALGGAGPAVARIPAAPAAVAPPTPPPGEGERLGPYEIFGTLGSGGMGIVYRARRPDLGRDFALKVIRPGAGATPQAVARFRREAQAAARLAGHPGIVGVHDIGEDAGRIWFTMDLVEGASLEEILDATYGWSRGGAPTVERESARVRRDAGAGPAPPGPGPKGPPAPPPGGLLTPRRAAEVIAEAARALHHAHTEGILHRDVKPSNILVGTKVVSRSREPALERQTTNDRPETTPPGVFVTDFGLAVVRGADPGATALTQPGFVMGTPAYMAPEQAEAGPVDARTDVWALGATLYECLTGWPPFSFGPSLDVLTAVTIRDPVPPRRRNPTVPRDLETVALKCLEKAPEKRYASAAALADDLERFLRGEPIAARPVSALGRLARRARRNPAPFAVAAVAAIALAGTAAAFALREWRESTRRAGAAGALVATGRAAADRHDAAARELRELLARPVSPGEDEAAEAKGRSIAEVRRRRDDAYAAAQASLRAAAEALAGDPESGSTDGARAILARLARERLVEAEGDGDAEAAARFEADLRAVAGPQDGAFLRGDGTLALDTDPSGTEVLWGSYEDRDDDGRLEVRDRGVLGTTPLTGVPVPMGSHLLVLRKAGLRDTRYPVLVERGRDVRVPERIPLLPDERIGAGFVWVPPGEAILGGDPRAANAWPRRRTLVPGFCISEHEVTFADYAEFILAVGAAEGEAAAQKRCPRRYAAGEHYWRMEGPDRITTLIEDFVGERPVVAIAWDDAVAYGRWRGAREGRPLRLPTEQEWERAGRGADGRSFPWGDGFSWRRLVAGRREDGRVWIRPVASAEADVSPFGVRDMAGSASEWCSDSPEGIPDHRITRGGAWAILDPNLCRLATRTLAPPIVVRDQVGFRLVAEPRGR